MKHQNKLALWSAIASLGLTSTALNIQAAHDDDEPSMTATRAAATNAPGGLGRVSGENRLIGSTVVGQNNQKLGEVDQIVIDLESGRILYVVLDTEGGDKRAIPPAVLGQGQNRGDKAQLRLKGDPQLLNNAPRFTASMDNPDRLGQASFVSQVYKHYGQSAWWQGPNAPANTGSFNNVHKASELPGMKVRNVSDQEVGQVNHVMMNLPRGRVVYVIFDPNQNLTQNDTDLYALPPNALTLHRDGKSLVTSLTQDKFASAPHFNRRSWPNLSDPSYGSRIYEFYGKEAYFDRGALAPTGRDEAGGRAYQESDTNGDEADDSEQGYRDYERRQDQGN